MVITRHVTLMRVALAFMAAVFCMVMLTTVAYAQQADPRAPNRGGAGITTERYTFKSGLGFIQDIGEGGYGAGVTGTNLQGIIGAIIRAALTLIGAIFLIMMVYGGYNWMIDRGDSERIKVAKDTITRAIIGLIIVMGAYAITNFITGRLVETAAGPATTPAPPT